MVHNPDSSSYRPLTTLSVRGSPLYKAETDNVLGFIYSRETLIAYCKLAEKYDLHLLVDEIYALSVFSSKGQLL